MSSRIIPSLALRLTTAWAASAGSSLGAMLACWRHIIRVTWSAPLCQCSCSRPASSLILSPRTSAPLSSSKVSPSRTPPRSAFDFACTPLTHGYGSQGRDSSSGRGCRWRRRRWCTAGAWWAARRGRVSRLNQAQLQGRTSSAFHAIYVTHTHPALANINLANFQHLRRLPDTSNYLG